MRLLPDQAQHASPLSMLWRILVPRMHGREIKYLRPL
jgi:hypothetical protein